VIGGQLDPPSPIISPNTSNQNFEIAILFSVVDLLIENMFLRRTLPQTLRARVLSYALEAYKVFIEGAVAETSKNAHSIGIQRASSFNSRK
jgi:hypothetical protein